MPWRTLVGMAGIGMLAGAVGCSDLTSPGHQASGAEMSRRGAPGDYVWTPGGRHHRSCIYEIEDGAVVGKNGVVRRRDGTQYLIPDCQYPSSPLSDTGFIEYASADNPGGNWASITASWLVPGSPLKLLQSNQEYAAFPGLTNGTEILQPALAYIATGHGPGWVIYSWHCNSGSNCVHSTTLNVNPGDVIDGAVSASACDSGNLTCTYTISTRDINLGTQTVLTFQAAATYGTAYGGVVETGKPPSGSGMTSCDEYPPNNVTFQDITLVDQTTGEQINGAAWTTRVQSNTSPNCNFGVTATAQRVELDANPESVTAIGPGVNTITPNCVPSIGVTCEGLITGISASGNTITLTSGSAPKGTITLTGATASGSFTASGGSCGLQQCTTPVGIASIAGNGTATITVTDTYSHVGHITLSGGTALSSGITGSGWIHALGSNAIIQNDANSTTNELVLK